MLLFPFLLFNQIVQITFNEFGNRIAAWGVQSYNNGECSTISPTASVYAPGSLFCSSGVKLLVI